MSSIQCPTCDHLHDEGDYPDHRDVGDTLDCESCGKTMRITSIDWDPEFSTEPIP